MKRMAINRYEEMVKLGEKAKEILAEIRENMELTNARELEREIDVNFFKF